MQKYEKVILKFCIQFYNQDLNQVENQPENEPPCMHKRKEQTLSFYIQMKKLWIFKNSQSYIYKKEVDFIEQSMK